MYCACFFLCRMSRVKMVDEERPIDRHESRRNPTNIRSMSRVNKWRDAWSACYRIVEEFTVVDLKQFHTIFERWVPILNWIFDRPIHHLNRYEPIFFYCYQPNGPKEIIKLYMDENVIDEHIVVYIIFNVYEFTIIQRRYCLDYTKSNQMLYNEARGTVNLASMIENEQSNLNPAEYFQTMTCWHLLFIYTLHALAHWDAYDKYEHAHYDTHLNVRDSPFFKFHFYGQVIYRK